MFSLKEERRASIHGNAFVKKYSQPPPPPFFFPSIVNKKTWTNSICFYFIFLKFRIEEAEAQCALLNSESLCVSTLFTVSHVRIIP